MRKLTFGLIIFCVVRTASGQNWQDEEHVWNEDEGKWEVKNRAGGRIEANVGNAKKTNRPFAGEPWERYLSKSVKYGKREPSEWEISEAKRKLWAKSVMQQRSAKRAEERRTLIAARRATGWYDHRRTGNHAYGNWLLQQHMRAATAYRGY